MPNTPSLPAQKPGPSKEELPATAASTPTPAPSQASAPRSEAKDEAEPEAVALMSPSSWAEAKGIPSWKLAAVVTQTRWVREPGRLVSEAEFAEALAALDNIRIGGEPPLPKADEPSAADKKEGL